MKKNMSSLHRELKRGKNMLSLTVVQTIAVWIAPVLLSITLHEAAHAWIASLCGDTTAKMLGRLSANPLKHIDPLGTVLVPLLVAVFSGFHFVFGWAKPVPINWNHLHNPRRDMAFVAAAGPIANIVMALVWAIYAKAGFLLKPESSNFALFIVLSGQAGVMINLVLAIVNLIPIPPLDGSRIMASILPSRLMVYYAQIENFGLLIMLTLLFTGVLGKLINTPISWAIQGICTMFGICR